jgi:Protein of unknown function (DUF1559)
MSQGHLPSTDQRGIRKADAAILVCILLLGAGILVPWLNSTRIHHRGMSESANRLKQIALAIHNYNDAFDGRLPALVDVGDRSPNNAGLNSLFFNILPYIEQDNVYRIFQKTTQSYVGPVTTCIVKAYIDPADQTGAYGTTISLGVALPWVPPAPFQKSFAGPYVPASYAANGLIFGSNDAGLPRTFKDGTSNTIMIAQRPQVCEPVVPELRVHNMWGFGYYGPETPAFALLTPDEPRGMPITGQASPVLPLSSEWTLTKIQVRIGRASAASVIPDFDTPFEHVVPGKPCDPRILGTPHASGLLVALGDGSVRSVAPKISSWTFWAACTPNGNETLYSDW